MKFPLLLCSISAVVGKQERQLSPVERLSSVISGLQEWKDDHLTGYKRYNKLSNKILEVEGRLLNRLQTSCAQPSPLQNMEELDTVSTLEEMTQTR